MDKTEEKFCCGFMVLNVYVICYLAVSLLFHREGKPMLTSIGGFSNDDGHGNKNIKTAIGLLIETTSLHVHHTFLYIS